MTREFQVVRPLAPLQFHDAALDYIVYIWVADGVVLTPPMIYRAENGLNFFRHQSQPLPSKFRTSPGAEHELTISVLVGFAFPTHSFQRAVQRELQAVTPTCNQLGSACQEVIAE